MKKFGLIGFPLSSSFSRKYFTEKFDKESIDAQYNLYPIENVDLLKNLVKDNDLCGLNVTIPYKQQLIPFLDEMDETASQIGAVNVIKFIRKNNTLTLKGYNSDAIGFEQSLLPLLQSQHKKALVLGTGGASKAVSYILKKNGIEVNFVSRTPKEGQISYQEITSKIMAEYKLIVNLYATWNVSG